MLRPHGAACPVVTPYRAIEVACTVSFCRPMRDAGPFALIVLAALLSCGTAAIAEAPKPNVIVILTDDLGWGDLSCYPKGPAWGHEAFVATPHLDQLAANGVRFTDAYATCMVCSPSRAALLSGRYQQRLGWYGFVEAVLATSPAP